MLGRQRLFTEAPVVAVLPVLNARKLSYFLQMLRLWGIVLATNILGTFIFAWVIASSDLFSASEHAKFAELSTGAFNESFGTTLLGAVFAGWLIALMVWLLPFAETARVLVIILLTYIIGLAGFPHVIAGAVDAFYGVLTGVGSWWDFLILFFIPTVVGNTLGGVILVAVLNYGQVAPPARDGNADKMSE